MKRGFTLIELLVTITIIAILAAISVSIYATAQANARDGRRRSELNSIAESIESARNMKVALYKYSDADFNNDFTNEPRPYVDPANYPYCIVINTFSTTPPSGPADLTGWVATSSANLKGTCPSVAQIQILKDSLDTSGGLELGTALSWTLCSYMERQSTPYCIKSLAR